MDALIDRYGRRIDYLRISVTDRCDLRCAYCMPHGFKGFEEPANWLNFDEIERVARLFAGMGVRHFRLTGGEPLLRRSLVELCGRLAAIPGIDDLSISTNATRLASMSQGLRAAGVKRLNVSLDSLCPERLEKITGRCVLDEVLAGLEAARSTGFSPIKVNMVAMQENLQDIDDVVAYCMERGFVLRLIEVMPMGEAARTMGHVDLQAIRATLRKRFNLVDTVLNGGGPARYLGTPDGRFNIGFITPISQHFCATCNRVRLTVDGVLYMCLGQDEHLNLRILLRSGCTDVELNDAIRQAVNLKPERHDFTNALHVQARLMSMTGG